MTEVQAALRADVARENGAKSRSPVSDLGKYFASLNSITNGEHPELLKEELPECVALLSSDCWISYLRLYQKRKGAAPKGEELAHPALPKRVRCTRFLNRKLLVGCGFRIPKSISDTQPGLAKRLAAGGAQIGRYPDATRLKRFGSRAYWLT